MNEIQKQTKESTRQRAKITPNTNAFAEHGKIPPQAIELEEAVLGALMLEQDALTTVIDILKPGTFYKEAHQRIFSAIHDLFAKSEPIDILTVTNELKNAGELELVGGPFYITQLTNRIASSANIEYHARILTQKYIQRELIRVSTEIIKDSYDDTTDVFNLLDKAEQNLFEVGERNLRRGSEEITLLLGQAIKQIEEAGKNEGGLSGIGSGFTELDRITSGWQRSELIIIAARPGMGKTALVLSMARNIAIDFKKTVAVFSLEMSSLQLVTRLISSETELPAEKLKKGKLEPYEWEQLNAKISKLTDANLIIDDTPALTIFELRAKCRRLKQRPGGIDLVVIDYIQLMAGSGDNKGNREQEISTISRSLKSLAKELDVPIICLSQLNRSVETRGGSKRPILSDLRESGAIEQDADMVLFIYRPEYYKLDEDEEGNSTKGKAELIIAKHRNGSLGNIRLKFIDKFAKFADIETDDFELPDSLQPNYDFEAGSNSYTVQSKMNDDSAEDDIPF